MVLARKKLNVNAIWIEDMKRAKHELPLFAVCLHNAEYPAALELHKIYRVIPDEDAARDGDLRVIDESGEDYLYSANGFAMLELPPTIQQAILHAA